MNRNIVKNCRNPLTKVKINSKIQHIDFCMTISGNAKATEGVTLSGVPQGIVTVI